MCISALREKEQTFGSKYDYDLVLPRIRYSSAKTLMANFMM
jgi:hypothetical protein